MAENIIIDGVDVSECNFTLERDGKIKCECCHATGFGVICDCEAWKTCYYKKYKRKEQAEKRLVGQMQTICDFINNRPETFKGIYGGVDKIITEYAERKEQECERLKRKCDENKAVISQLQQWQDENLRQIAELKRIKDDFFKQAEISHEAVLNKNKIIEKLEKERNKLKQTLTEIKEITENVQSFVGRIDIEDDVCEQMEQILQKISEVKNV